MSALSFTVKQDALRTAKAPKSPRNIFTGAVFILIILVYMFFFFSPTLLSDTSSLLYTTIGQAQQIAPKRTVTVNSWEYSPTQRLMLVELSMKNLQYDGQNNYRFSAKARGLGLTELPTTVMLASPDLCVVEISKVPSDFNEVLLGIYIDSEEYDGAAIPVYTNKEVVSRVGSITAKSEVEYRVSSLERSIQTYEQSIVDLEDLILESETRIENINAEILAVEQEKKYMTAAQMQEANRSINESESKITMERSTISSARDEITEYQTRIALAYQEIKDLQGGEAE